MALKATQVVRPLLRDPSNPEAVLRLVAPDASYVSLNFENHELIMPWLSTRVRPNAVLDTYTRVNRLWRSERFEMEELFGDGGTVAMFGPFDEVAL